MESEETKYEGWTNYETWCVALWIDNEEASHLYWRDQVQRHRKEAAGSLQVEQGVWTADEAVRFNLADQLKDDVTEGAPSEDVTMYSDLLAAAISNVNWVEIADHWLASDA